MLNYFWGSKILNLKYFAVNHLSLSIDSAMSMVGLLVEQWLRFYVLLIVKVGLKSYTYSES